MPEQEAKAPDDNKKIRDYNDEVALRNYKRERARERSRAKRQKLLELSKGAVRGIKKASASYKASQKKQVRRVAKKTNSNKLLHSKPLQNPFRIGKL